MREEVLKYLKERYPSYVPCRDVSTTLSRPNSEVRSCLQKMIRAGEVETRDGIGSREGIAYRWVKSAGASR